MENIKTENGLAICMSRISHEISTFCGHVSRHGESAAGPGLFSREEHCLEKEN